MRIARLQLSSRKKFLLKVQDIGTFRQTFSAQAAEKEGAPGKTEMGTALRSSQGLPVEELDRQWGKRDGAVVQEEKGGSNGDVQEVCTNLTIERVLKEARKITRTDVGK